MPNTTRYLQMLPDIAKNCLLEHVELESIVVEKNREFLVSQFKKKIESSDFQEAFRETLLKYELKDESKRDVLFDHKEGRLFLFVDVAPEGLLDTETIIRIIRKVKPKTILYVAGREDDWGSPAYLTIPTENEEIRLSAYVYVIDQAGGIWTKFNDPSSDGYKSVVDPLSYPFGKSGRFELQI